MFRGGVKGKGLFTCLALTQGVEGFNMKKEKGGRMKPSLARLAEYIAGFLSNLAVAGVALAVFKSDETLTALLASLFALAAGGVIVYLIGGKK